MRGWAIFSLLVALLQASASAETPLGAQRQTFVVQSSLGGDKAVIGSGVVVARTGNTLTLATAAHLIVPDRPLRILDQSRNAYYDVIDVRTRAEYDLALVRVRAQPSFDVTPVQMGTATPDERVWLWGHPSGFWVMATGLVLEPRTSIPGVDGAPRMTIRCASCARGDSGSGVFDAGGALLGILTRAWRDGSGGPVRFLEVEPAALIIQQLNGEAAGSDIPRS